VTGRALPPTSPFAGDDGSAPAPLAAALALPDPQQRLEAVVAVLPQVRLLVPVVAHLDERAEPTHPGEVVGEKSAHAAMVTVALPDGRSGLPVFSSLAALTAWRSDARPVPVDGRRAALAAGSECDGVLVLDGGGPGAVQVPRPAVRAIALGEDWLPAVRHPAVAAAVDAALGPIPGVVGTRVEAGSATEIRVVVLLAGGVDADGARAVVRAAQEALARSAEVVDLVDSVTVRPATVGP
jgi:hypothetical protein